MPETKDLKLYADWLVVTPDGGQRHPVSINCVTVGSTADEVKERIGELRRIPDADGNENEDGFFRAECSSESWRAVITGSQKTVSAIVIYDRTQGSDPSGK